MEVDRQKAGWLKVGVEVAASSGKGWGRRVRARARGGRRKGRAEQLFIGPDKRDKLRQAGAVGDVIRQHSIILFSGNE